MSQLDKFCIGVACASTIFNTVALFLMRQDMFDHHEFRKAALGGLYDRLARIEWKQSHPESLGKEQEPK